MRVQNEIVNIKNEKNLVPIVVIVCLIMGCLNILDFVSTTCSIMLVYADDSM